METKFPFPNASLDDILDLIEVLMMTHGITADDLDKLDGLEDDYEG